MNYDEYGIPILNREGVEDAAEAFLDDFAPPALRHPIGTPIRQVFSLLEKKGLCSISRDDDLGYTPEGTRCLAYYSPPRRHIAIDRSLRNADPRFPFTCAHELGHFRLHTKVAWKAIGRPDGIKDSRTELLTHATTSMDPRKLLEWQANRFASSILVPRRTIGVATLSQQKALGFRRPGRIWVDHQPINQHNFRLLVRSLAEQYQVSQAVVKYRLRELNMVEIAKGQEFSAVGGTLQAVLEALYS